MAMDTGKNIGGASAVAFISNKGGNENEELPDKEEIQKLIREAEERERWLRQYFFPYPWPL